MPQISLSVIPADRTVVKNGVPLQFDFAADEFIHAVQWYGTWGVIERKTGGTTYLGDFASVKQWSDAWDAEKARLDALVVDDSNTPAKLIAKFESALDAHLDAVARAHRYDNRITFATRAGYPNRWRTEATAFGIWMDGCNAQAYDLLRAVIGGTAQMPASVEDFIATLPPFVAPGG